MDMLQSKQV